MSFKSNFAISAMAVACLSFIGGTVHPAAADILDVPGDFPTIQAAIDASVDGDEVVVHPGTYDENINLLGRAIIVRSSDGAGVTTIDAQGSGTVVTCSSGEGPDTVVDGFTITGGSAARGGGMYNLNSGPTVRDCTFIANTATDDGNGMCNDNSTAFVENCIFMQNTGTGDGGGMCNSGGSPAVTGCTFSANVVSGAGANLGGGMLNDTSSPTIVDCTFEGNEAIGSSNSHGGAMFNTVNSDPTITGCTFIANFSANTGGGVGNNSNSNPMITDCLFSKNTAGGNGGAIHSKNSSVPTVAGSTFCGNTPDHIFGPYNDKGGNVFADECEVIVSLDIKPGSCPNPLNRNSHGFIPISILGTDDFDVTLIDVDSVRLTRAFDGVGSVAPNDGPPGPPIRIQDTGTPFFGDDCDCHDLEGDGIEDLSMKFPTQEVVTELQLDEFEFGDFVMLEVTGTLLDGTPFVGRDCVMIVGRHR